MDGMYVKETISQQDKTKAEIPYIEHTDITKGIELFTCTNNLTVTYKRYI